jgi:hypothetical protein
MKFSRLVILPMLLLAACGGVVAAAPSSTTQAETVTTIRSTTTLANYPSEIVQVPDNRTQARALSVDSIANGASLAARASGELEVFEMPSDSDPMLTLPATTILGTTTVLSVVRGPIDGWVKVRLPIRPNGSEGWVSAASLSLFVVDGRLIVDLSERTLTYYERGEEILVTPVAVGSSRNPTPTGSFFVTDNVTLANPDSPWGPFAFGLSARSDTITEYNGGDGIIGIHGTNRPSSIGNAASLGCVRLPNDVITELHRIVAVGTPVEIVA